MEAHNAGLKWRKCYPFNCMCNAKMVVNVLLLATVFSTAYHYATPASRPVSVKMSVFLTLEDNQPPVLMPRTAKKESIPYEVYGAVYTVTATAYQAVGAQTDDEPFVTADNSFIEPDYSSKIRWLAVSQDLLVHWGGRIKYGTQVEMRGVSPELDGLYTVHDTMNKRHHHCIDILSNPREKLDFFVKKVRIQRARWPIASSKASSGRLVSSRASRGKRPLGLVPYRRPAKPNYLASAIL